MSLVQVLLFTTFWGTRALAQNSVLVYPTSSSVSFSRSATPQTSGGFFQCRLTITEATPAEVVERREGLVHLRFAPGSFDGCFLDKMRGRNIAEGWIPEDQITYGANDNEALTPARPIVTPNRGDTRPGAPCPEPMNEQASRRNYADIGDLVQHVRAETAGMKPDAGIEKYMECYPYNARGKADYPKYRPVIDKVVETFSADLGNGSLFVNKSLFKCLLRRESGYDVTLESHTGAVGLGQHTDINIKHISNRLSKKNSWERQLWDRFFAQISKTPEGKKMLAECPQTAGGQAPTFNSKSDARCPLNSMAASAIYNLQVQQALRKSSQLKDVDWSDDLTYQLAIGATYNLGDGAASKAVDDLALEGWVDSIRQRSSKPAKRAEVAGHIEALRNCMQAGNWKGMHAGDRPQCDLAAAREPSTSGPVRNVPLPPRRPAGR